MQFTLIVQGKEKVVEVYEENPHIRNNTVALYCAETEEYFIPAQQDEVISEDNIEDWPIEGQVRMLDNQFFIRIGDEIYQARLFQPYPEQANNEVCIWVKVSNRREMFVKNMKDVHYESEPQTIETDGYVEEDPNPWVKSKRIVNATYVVKDGVNNRLRRMHPTASIQIHVTLSRDTGIEKAIVGSPLLSQFLGQNQ